MNKLFICVISGPVMVTADGAALRVEPITSETVEMEEGWVVVPSSDQTITAEPVQELRDADQC